MLLLIPPPEVNCVEASSDNTFYSSLLESAALGFDEGLWNLNILNVMSSLNQLSVPLKSFSISHSFIVLKSVWILWQSSKVCVLCVSVSPSGHTCVCVSPFSPVYIWCFKPYTNESLRHPLSIAQPTNHPSPFLTQTLFLILPLTQTVPDTRPNVLSTM